MRASNYETGVKAAFSELTKEAQGEAAALFCDVYGNEPWNFSWINKENVERYIGDLLATPGFRGFIGATGGRINALCLGVIDDYFSAPTYELKEICVGREAQGKGVGRRFLSYVEGELKKEGVAAVTLVTRESIGAFRFYIRNGYKKSATSVHMNKILT